MIKESYYYYCYCYYTEARHCVAVRRLTPLMRRIVENGGRRDWTRPSCQLDSPANLSVHCWGSNWNQFITWHDFCLNFFAVWQLVPYFRGIFIPYGYSEHGKTVLYYFYRWAYAMQAKNNYEYWTPRFCRDIPNFSSKLSRRDDMPPPMPVRLAADLRPSADGSAVRTSLVAGQLQAASVPIA